MKAMKIKLECEKLQKKMSGIVTPTKIQQFKEELKHDKFTDYQMLLEYMNDVVDVQTF